MKTLTKDDSEFKNYVETVEPYVGDFEAMNVPYWILVEKDQVVGIVMVGEEPLKVIEPMGTTVSVVLIVDYEQTPEIMDDLAKEAVRIAKEQSAVYSFIDLPEKYEVPITSFLKNGYDEIARSQIMKCKLKGNYEQSSHLRFEKIESEEVPNFFSKMKNMMSGSPDVMLEIIISNLENFPEQLLDHWYQQELLYYVYEDDELVGVLDICPNSNVSISNIGVSPQCRGKGYGKQIMLYALNLLKEQGKDESGLRVHVDNKVAIKLYESLGFVKDKTNSALIWRK